MWSSLMEAPSVDEQTTPLVFRIAPVHMQPFTRNCLAIQAFIGRACAHSSVDRAGLVGYVLWDRRSSIYNSPCVGACVHGRQARPGRSTRAGGRAMIKALGVVRHREAARGPCCRVGVAHARASSSSMDRSPWCGRCDAMIARTMHACILYCARQQLAQVRGADPNSNARSRTSWWPGRGRG